MSHDMADWFAVESLDVEQLLGEWRWLCAGAVSLIARDAFGDLFLRDSEGLIFRLDVAIGKLVKVADSEAQFRELATGKREEWFAESDEASAAAQGLKPKMNECIGFTLPIVLRSTSTKPTSPYIADLYEYVSFLGDFNRQIAGLPWSRGATRKWKRAALRKGFECYRLFSSVD
jgi:hypothetical protein